MDLEVPVGIVGLNAVGEEAGNETMTDGRDLPWLQDVADQDVWGDWNVTYRDVLVVDAENEPVSVLNLTANDLGEAASYDALKEQILGVAR